MMDPLFIDDGFTRDHDIAAVAGLHPAVAVKFRPVLDRERKTYDAKMAGRDPDVLEKYENEVLARQILELNGKPPAEWKDKLSRLHPTVRTILLNLVFSFSAAKRVEAEGNSSGA